MGYYAGKSTVSVFYLLNILQNKKVTFTWCPKIVLMTGETPDDPLTGFLPPNNGTTGQGYVTFSVRLKKNVQSLARIDAKASIYFDKNEPIDTPPIFNTVRSLIKL